MTFDKCHMKHSPVSHTNEALGFPILNCATMLPYPVAFPTVPWAADARGGSLRFPPQLPPSHQAHTGRDGESRRQWTSEIPALSRRENLPVLPALCPRGRWRTAICQRDSRPGGTRPWPPLIPLACHTDIIVCWLRAWAKPEQVTLKEALVCPWAAVSLGVRLKASPETLPWFILSNWAGAGRHSTNIYWVPITWRPWCQGDVSVLFDSVNIHLEAYTGERWSITGSRRRYEPSCLVHTLSHISLAILKSSESCIPNNEQHNNAQHKMNTGCIWIIMITQWEPGEAFGL